MACGDIDVCVAFAGPNSAPARRPGVAGTSPLGFSAVPAGDEAAFKP